MTLTRVEPIPNREMTLDRRILGLYRRPGFDYCLGSTRIGFTHRIASLNDVLE